MTKLSRRRAALRAGVLTAAVAVAASSLFAASAATAGTTTSSPRPTVTAASALPGAPSATQRGLLTHSLPAASRTAAQSARVAKVTAAASAAATASAGATSATAATAAASQTSPYGASDDSPFLITAGGRVWFVDRDSTDHWVLKRVEPNGTTTAVALPDDSFEPYAFPGPDGNVWVWSPTSGSTTASGDLSRVDGNGVLTSEATNVSGQFELAGYSSGALWILHGISSMLIAPDGSVTDYPVNLSDTQIGAVSTDGTLWTVDSSNALTGLNTDGSTITTDASAVASALGQGNLVTIEATADGAAWLAADNGALANVQPSGSVTAVVAPNATSSWLEDDVALAVGASPSEIWMLRTADAAHTSTAILHVTETGQRLVDVTDPYDFAPLGASDDSVFADSSDRLWFGEFSETGTDLRVHMASTQNGTITRYPEPEGVGFDFVGFQQAADGKVWALLDSYATLTAASVEVFDPTTSAVAQYPVQTGFFPYQLVFDGSGQPWLSYARVLMSGSDFSDGGSYWGAAPTTAVQRIAGADRYATSVAFSQHSFPSGAPVVYLASGQNFPDGLSAGPAAGAQGGPLLLTPTASVPATVRNEISRLHPSKIVVVGGPASVSNAAFAQLNGLAPTVTRVYGADRYATSAAVAAEAFPSGASTAFLATGATFPDALSAAGAAGAAHAPVLLVNGSASSLSASTVALLKSLHVTSIQVLGGTGSVSPGIASAAAKIAPTTRLSGADRYATSSAVAESMTGTGAWDTAYVVSGANFADALSAGAVAAAGGHPIVLSTYAGLTSQASSDFTSHGTTQVDVLGGDGSLSWAVGGLEVAGTTLGSLSY